MGINSSRTLGKLWSGTYFVVQLPCSSLGLKCRRLVSLEIWWAWQDSNLQPRDYESPALTVVLQAHLWMVVGRYLVGACSFPRSPGIRALFDRALVVSRGGSDRFATGRGRRRARECSSNTFLMCRPADARARHVFSAQFSISCRGATGRSNGRRAPLAPTRANQRNFSFA
jgi:hypothetical protein